MAEIVRMPKLSDTMTEGVVAKWHKKLGDTIKSGDLLADIETDKATMEFESFQEGILLYIGVDQGKTAPVDSILAILGNKNDNIDDILKNEKKKTEETSIVKKENNTTSEPIKIEVEKPQNTTPSTTPLIQSSSTKTDKERIKISPLAKKIAEEKGLKLTALTGSGEEGRIVKRDIENLKSDNFYNITEIEKHTDESVSQMRKTIAKRLSDSKNGSPHFYLTMEINMDECIKTREAINNTSETKISFNDLVIKAVASSLNKHPKVNASWLGDTIRYYSHIHIGVAVAVEDGLLVPVIKFANNKRLTQIASEIKNLAVKAKNKKLQPTDWEGNTFTISNLGMFGIDEFTAIINPPDSCILAVGGIKQTAIVKNGQIEIGNIMKVTLSCDHRVVDGATGAAFLQTLKHNLENPVLMLGVHSI